MFVRNNPKSSLVSLEESLSLFFFVSSRRGHTSSKRDWSSDVCSSDLDAVRSVAAGRTLLHPRQLDRRRRSLDDPTAALTATERRVVDLIGDGCSNREIADRLGMEIGRASCRDMVESAALLSGRKHEIM